MPRKGGAAHGKDKADVSLSSDLEKALAEVKVHDHLCLIYESHAEQMATVIPFIRMGLERNERCVYIADENTVAAVEGAMRMRGVDVAAAAARGALDVVTERETYLKEGRFDPDAMIAFLAEATESAKKSGFGALRVTGEMTSVLGGEPGTERLAEYEAKLNRFFSQRDALAICQYNLKRLKPATIIGAIHTHLLVICGGDVFENRDYVPPEEYVKPEEERMAQELSRWLADIRHRRDLENEIRKRKKAESALRKAKDRFETSLGTMVDGFGIYSAVRDECGRIIDFKVEYVNETACELHRMSREEQVGKNLCDTLPRHRETGLFDEYVKVVRTGEPLAKESYEYEDMCGEKRRARVFDIRASRIDDGFAASWRDVTERRRAEGRTEEALKELERSNIELEQFAYAVSHDLREPLRTMAGFAGLLEQRYRGRLDRDAREFLQFIVGAADRASQMIDDLLTYSRVATQAKPFAPVRTEDVVNCVLDNLSLRIEESGATVTRGTLPLVEADEGQLTSVLQNLVDNAIKFRGTRPPRVRITVQEQGGERVFSVKDNGMGIDPKDQERIFGVFQRLHPIGKHAGTGIGLATCKRIVERHGGRIWVESAPGKGSTFYFTIPRRAGESAAGAPEEAKGGSETRAA